MLPAQNQVATKSKLGEGVGMDEIYQKRDTHVH